ncbi:ANTAR domain-containing protein [uncultured Jatrophihabitans sp.]|uniref:ANTAR domain-containing protein n=1 Tax=uncultured Jatrophihabitans sp. TaxID=1610747 RepID=UPI0035CAF7A9
MTATGRTGDGGIVQRDADGASGADLDLGVDFDADDDVTGCGEVRPFARLVPSVEPSVVFTSLAAQCVPDLCDDCTIDMVDGSRAQYGIVFPPRTTSTGGLLRLADRAGVTPDHRLQVPFAAPHLTRTIQDQYQEAGPREEFHGVATFVWHRRVPTRSDHIAAAVLVERAVQTVVSQRSEQAWDIVAADVEHLELALRTSRRIGAAVGILMTVHKITAEKSFDLLVQASHRSNRKLRDLAEDVVDTGCLDSQPAASTTGSVTSESSQSRSEPYAGRDRSAPRRPSQGARCRSADV